MKQKWVSAQIKKDNKIGWTIVCINDRELSNPRQSDIHSMIRKS